MAFALRGLVAGLFGLWIIIWPGLALFTLPLLLTPPGVYMLVDGIVAFVASRRSSERRRLLLLVEGIPGILAGLVAIFQPGIAALAVLYLVAVWAVLSGLSTIASAVRGWAGHEWLMVASGVISVIFGVVLVSLPGAGTLTPVWVVGSYATAVGVAFIAYSYRLRCGSCGEARVAG